MSDMPGGDVEGIGLTGTSCPLGKGGGAWVAVGSIGGGGIGGGAGATRGRAEDGSGGTVV